MALIHLGLAQRLGLRCYAALMKKIFWVFLLLAAGASPAYCLVESFQQESTEVIAEGRSFGQVGPYEKLTGKLTISLDPAKESIVDLDLAPRDADGRVRFKADLYLLRPVHAERGRRTLFLEVPNRGGKAIVRYFNRGAARSFDPVSAESVGDGFLMEQGYTLAWIGWQFDVPDTDDLMRVDAVPANAGGAIEGLVRADHVFEQSGNRFELGHEGHRAYLPTSPEDERHRLTVRDTRLGPKTLIPREKWDFLYPNEKTGAGLAVIYGEGFEKGRIYELVYASADPVVVGVGLAALRDGAAWLRDSEDSPVKVQRNIAMGISQTGRLLRHFLYQGFNQLAGGGKAFDGVIAHTAGAGRGSFNHRFAQPSRDAHRFRAFFYPTDIYPFSDTIQRDSETGLEEGLLDRLRKANAVPKIFFTNTGYEYWGRNAALVHASLDGRFDVDPGPGVRAYHFASTQHFVGPFPPQIQATRYPANPVDFLWSLRALLLAMDNWVAKGIEPPPSRLPTLANGSLVPLEGYRFPRLPGVDVPAIAHNTWRLDFGPRFRGEGIVDFQPPRVGKPFPILVPQADADGNELGGIRLPQVEVPLATYTPWNFRSKDIGAPDELANFRGAFLPFSLTSEGRNASGDPRLSIAERYASRDEYLGHYAREAMELARDGYLLEGDLAAMLLQAAEQCEYVVGSE
jgi:hypothetical protein